jgi:ATP-dependent RNA helicase DDX31/DBP7
MPKQLKQAWVEVPTKLRTMALAAALRSATRRGKPSKVVVFMSSCDGVEFHHLLLGPYFEQASGEKLLQCPLLKLHGDMLQVCASVCVCVCGGGKSLAAPAAHRGLEAPQAACFTCFT